MSTYMANANTIERRWFVIDAAGKPLGRTAVAAANILRGKHRPEFTPHADCGVYQKIATALGLDVNYLLTENEEFVMGIAEQYGARGAQGATKVLSDVKALFAGGEMAEEDMDVVMKAVQDAYWEVKKINKEKYTPKKYQKKDND